MANQFEIIATIDPLEHDTLRGIGKYNNELVYFDVKEHGHGIIKKEWTQEIQDIIQNYLQSNEPEYGKTIYTNKYYTITDFTQDDKLNIHVCKHPIYNIYRVPSEIINKLQLFADGFFDEEEKYHRFDNSKELIAEYHRTGKWSTLVFDKCMMYLWDLPVDTFEHLGMFSINCSHQVCLLTGECS